VDVKRTYVVDRGYELWRNVASFDSVQATGHPADEHSHADSLRLDSSVSDGQVGASQSAVPVLGALRRQQAAIPYR
jgi:hypothetical protein